MFKLIAIDLMLFLVNFSYKLVQQKCSDIASLGPFCEKKSNKNKNCVLIWNGEKCDQKWFSVIQNGRWEPFCENKSYWYEMVRNAIKSDFRSSKKKIKKKSCVLIWNGEKCNRKLFSVIQNGHRQPFGDFFFKYRSCVLIWNGEKCDRKRFSVIQNGRRQPLSEQNQKSKKLRIDLKWREMRSKVIFGHPKWQPFCEKKSKKNKNGVLIWNGEKCDRKWFSVIQNGRRQPFCEQNQKK